MSDSPQRDRLDLAIDDVVARLTAADPDPDLRRRVLARVRAPRPRPERWLAPAAVAAALLIAAGVTLVRYERGTPRGLSGPTLRATASADRPAAATATAAATPGLDADVPVPTERPPDRGRAASRSQGVLASRPDLASGRSALPARLRAARFDLRSGGTSPKPPAEDLVRVRPLSALAPIVTEPIEPAAVEAPPIHVPPLELDPIVVNPLVTQPAAAAEE